MTKVRSAVPDDTGSMAIATILLVVVFLQSALLLPLVTNQLHATRSAEARDRALNAAQAGVQSAAGQIRAAVDSAGAGSVAALPGCLITGEPGIDTGPRARFQVTVTYRSKDGTDLGCTPTDVPAQADFVSTGTVSARTAGTTIAVRTLDATYTFRSEARNTPGGLLYLLPPDVSDPPLCLAASTAEPVTGTPVRAAGCNTASALQKFVYNRRLQVVAANSVTQAHPLGMCVQSGGAGITVVFRPCVNPTPANQQWIFNSGAMFESVATAGYCLTLDSYTAGSRETLRTCNGAGIWQYQVVSPGTTMGAGAAGPATDQLVNFDQFGRCLDVTLSDVDYAYLIVWPCKQAVDPADIDWNQRWSFPAVDPLTAQGTGSIIVQLTDKPVQCLKSPQSAAVGAYVKVAPCPVGPRPANLTWTVQRNTGAWATSYRIRDAAGLCLAPTDPDAPDPDLYPLYGHEISKSVVRPCDDSAEQKWNADPYLLGPTPVHFVGER
jgi:type II secretory pathway pseudopilin PulG